MASAVLSVLISGLFTFLIVAIIGMRDTAALATHSERVLASAHDLERLIVDMETGQRGYLITHDERFLQPWTAARANFDAQAAELRRLALARSASQGKRAAKIERDGQSYIRDYSVPLVEAVRRNPASEVTGKVSLEGKQRVDLLRSEFGDFTRNERRLAAERDARSDRAAGRAILVAASGTALSIVLIVGFSGYLTRAVVRPVRRTSVMAGEVARGDLSVRMPETGPADIGHLQHSFNSMAASLERNRDELQASRARIVAAGDAARRRIERDLHDGTQQRLVTLGLELRMAEEDMPSDQIPLKNRLSCLVRDITDVIGELREISRGIHPAILSRGGLAPAIATLTRRSPIPVEDALRIDRRLDERTEVAVYYVVCEALTNAARYARASCIWVELTADDEGIRLLIRDDGVGGADPARGSGLIGIQDRVEALGGTIEVTSPVNGGTTILVRLPTG